MTNSFFKDVLTFENCLTREFLARFTCRKGMRSSLQKIVIVRVNNMQNIPEILSTIDFRCSRQDASSHSSRIPTTYDSDGDHP